MELPIKKACKVEIVYNTHFVKTALRNVKLSTTLAH